MSIKIKGLDSVIRGMGKYDKKVETMVHNEAKKLMINIVADAVRDAKVDTNFMRSNIRVFKRGKNLVAASLANYSSIVDERFPFFELQAKKKIAKFIPKIQSIIKAL